MKKEEVPVELDGISDDTEELNQIEKRDDSFRVPRTTGNDWRGVTFGESDNPKDKEMVEQLKLITKRYKDLEMKKQKAHIPRETKERFQKQGRKFKHQIDTNVVRLKLKVIQQDAELAAGDPIY